MSRIRLHRQVCAYLDVLGGAHLFRGKDRNRASGFFELLSNFERRLNGWSQYFPKKRQSTSLVRTFSDNIFVAFPLRSNPEADDEDVVSFFISELVQQIHQMTRFGGFPLRGGVTVGSLMLTDQYVFGPALVEAVALEKAALFPRVLVSKTALRYMRADRPNSRFLLRDSDGQTFLHYLCDENRLGWHRDYVQSGLQNNSNRVHERQKYEWLGHGGLQILGGIEGLTLQQLAHFRNWSCTYFVNPRPLTPRCSGHPKASLLGVLATLGAAELKR